MSEGTVRVTLTAIGLEVIWAALFAGMFAMLFIPYGSRATLWVLSLSAWLCLWTSPWMMIVAVVAAHVARRDRTAHVSSLILIGGLFPTIAFLFIVTCGGFLAFTGVWGLPLSCLIVISTAFARDLTRSRRSRGEKEATEGPFTHHPI